MNTYQKFMAKLSDDQRNLLSCYQCAWCSQPGNAPKCGIPEGCEDPKCSPASRVEAAMEIINAELPL